jgi:DNA-binding PadR family transcriptional regulator
MFHHFHTNWSDEPRPGFAGAGDFGPEGDEGWQPWARRERDERHGRRGHERSRQGGGPDTAWGPWDLPIGPLIGPVITRFARRFPFGPGMGPGSGGFGPRMFGRGDLKYALLELLMERPKHGYEMIKDLEDRSGGFYTPSAGAIYPTLQLLEDRGWVTADTLEGKRVYQITDSGRAALNEYRARREPFGGPRPWGPPGHGPGRHFGEERGELRSLRHESMEVARLMRAAVMASEGRPERLGQLREIMGRARGDLNAFLGQPGGSQPGPGGGTPPPGGGPGAPGSGPIEEF